MKSKAIIPLVLGVVVGLAAIKLGVDAIQRAQGQTPELVTALVAVADIPASFQITAEMVNEVETPRTPLLPEGVLTKKEAVVGRVTSKSIPAGGVLSAAHLAPEGTLPGLTERIKEGYRAVSVKIDEVSGVAGQVSPGAFVDVIVVMGVHRGKKTETISRIILQRVEVVAVGQNLGAPTAEGGAQPLARSVTLLIRDSDVPKLHLAQTQGRVTLAMRGADDRMVGDEGLASTRDWEPEEEEKAAAEPDTTLASSAGPSTPMDRLAHMLGRGQAPSETRLFEVAVFNGPLTGGATAAVQRVTYESRDSMKVVRVDYGRSSDGTGGSPDSAESVLRDDNGASGEDDLQVPRRVRRGGTDDEPDDREITGE